MALCHEYVLKEWSYSSTILGLATQLHALASLSLAEIASGTPWI
jgi:hypothetical protein